MDSPDKNKNLGIIAGAALIVLGAYYIIQRVAGPALQPLRTAFDFIWSIGWPLALVALGIALIVRRDSLHPVSGVQGRRLYRSRTDKMASGVLGGLAVYMGIDSTLLRIGFALLAILSGFGPALIGYIIATIVIPEAPIEGAVEAEGAPRQAPPAPPIPKPPAS